MSRYDIAVIGTGPAGLSAAITAKIRNKNVLLLGKKDLSLKLQKAHTIRNYLGFPDISGSDLAAAFSRHLTAMELSVTEDKVTAIYAMGSYFALQASSGQMYEADAIILATGVIPGRTLPGETDLLGRGVSYCATCDAPLYRGKEVAVIGYSAQEEREAAFLSEVASRVYYIPMYKDPGTLPAGVDVLAEKALEIREEGGRRQVLTSGPALDVDGVFVLRDAVSPGQLVPGLETDGSHVKVDLSMSTNIAGCFACGDIAGLPYQYIKAAGQGNTAALSAVSWLDAQKAHNRKELLNGQEDFRK